MTAEQIYKIWENSNPKSNILWSAYKHAQHGDKVWSDYFIAMYHGFDAKYPQGMKDCVYRKFDKK